MTWPKEYGGQERPWMDLLILFEELAYARVPWAAAAICWSMSNTVLDLGSEELKQEFLPGIGRGETILWLAMSEPDAGSDLMAMRRVVVDPELFYAESASVVECLMRRGDGLPRFVGFARKVARDGLASALRSCYGFQSVAEFERAWRSSLDGEPPVSQ